MQERREKMLALVAHWRESRLSRKQFCAQVGITLSKFNYLGNQRTGANSEWICGTWPVQSSAAKEVTYPNGVRLQAPADLSLLSRLIHLINVLAPAGGAAKTNPALKPPSAPLR